MAWHDFDPLGCGVCVGNLALDVAEDFFGPHRKISVVNQDLAGGYLDHKGIGFLRKVLSQGKRYCTGPVLGLSVPFKDKLTVSQLR